MDQSTDLRRQILDASRQVMVEEGYRAISMRRIAQTIGYSATSIYLHFKNKDALVHALIDEGMASLYDELTRVIASARPGDHPLDTFRSMCRAYLSFGLSHPSYYEVMFMAHPEQMGRYPAENYRRARRNLDVLVEALEAGRASGALHLQGPVRVVASTVWASLHGAVTLLLAQRLDARMPESAFIDAMVHQIVCGMRAPSVSTPSS